MKKSIQNSKALEGKIEKILGHQIINEFDPEKGRYYEIKKYKIKWVGNPECTWEKESNLVKYEKIVNDYKKLIEEKEVDNSEPKEDEFKTSLYTEFNMRLDDKYITQKDGKNNNFSLNNFQNFEKEKIKENINKNFNENEIISLDESSSEINIVESKSKNLNNSKKDKKVEEINLNKPDYSNFGPNFNDVLKAGQNKELNEENKEKKFLNKKRKNKKIDKIKLSQNKKIYRIIVPSDKNKDILVSCKMKSEEKNKIIEDSSFEIEDPSNSDNIPKNELLKCYKYIIKSNINKIPSEELINVYEQIIKKYLPGNTYNFD